MVSRHEERAWSSATFSGAKHVLELGWPAGSEAEGQAFLEYLPAADFQVPGILVADAVVRWATCHVAGAPPRLTAQIEILTLELA